MNTLYIDTRDNKQTIIRLTVGKKTFQQKSAAVSKNAQTILPLIEKILSKSSIKIGDIDEINVETGPGSFTGLRVGIAIANALSFAGQVRVNGKELGEIVLPEY